MSAEQRSASSLADDLARIAANMDRVLALAAAAASPWMVAKPAADYVGGRGILKALEDKRLITPSRAVDGRVIYDRRELDHALERGKSFKPKKNGRGKYERKPKATAQEQTP